MSKEPVERLKHFVKKQSSLLALPDLPTLPPTIMSNQPAVGELPRDGETAKREAARLARGRFKN
jgi:hypothetical protein